MSLFTLLHDLELCDNIAAPHEFEFQLRRVGSKQRRIAVPSPALYELHQLLLRRLRRLEIVFPNAYGGIPGRSPIQNAHLHRRGTHFFKLDFKNAYPSVDSSRLARVLSSLDASLGTVGEITDFLEQFCMVERGLAQGGPASPLLFNLYCESEVDQQLRAILWQTDKEGLPTVVYSRYIDDLTFSAERPFPRVLRRKIRGVIQNAGFEIHPQKNQLLVSGKDAIEVTGVRILPDGQFEFAEEFRRKFSRILTEWLLALEPDNTDYVRGLVGYYVGFRRWLSNNRNYRNLDAKVRRVQERLLWPKADRLRLYPEAWMQELKTQATLEAVIGPHVKFKWRRGSLSERREAVGLCPFHRERTPSFTISPYKGFYHCFGCGAHGDVIGFVQRMQGLGFRGAVEYLSDQFNVPRPGGRPVNED